MPSPYHRFWFSGAFTIVPPTAAPFQPSSGKMMAMFAPSSTSSTEAAHVGFGPLTANPCFRFDFQGLRIGCEGTEERCKVMVTGIRHDGSGDVAAGSASLEVAPCSKADSCSLSTLFIGGYGGTHFTNLTAINITAEVNGEARRFWTDDISMTWTNNSCDASLCRSKVRNSITDKRSSLSSVLRRLLRFA